jgi:hypothetical protein
MSCASYLVPDASTTVLFRDPAQISGAGGAGRVLGAVTRVDFTPLP